MLRPRLIPTLLIHNNGLVKSTEFKDYRYIGDPINAVKIFNEKESDELMVLDIDAGVENREPNYKLIEKLSNECRMPLSYGGGIRTFEQAIKILSFGVEKIVISSLFYENQDEIKKIIEVVGSQSVVLCIDFKKSLFSSNPVVYSKNGKNKIKVEIDEIIEIAHKIGIGEIIFQSIDNDGKMKGLDLKTLIHLKSLCSVPITVIGGVGSFDHFIEAIQKLGIVGIGAGSFFVYKGKLKGVLITYPSQLQRDEIIHSGGLLD